MSDEKQCGPVTLQPWQMIIEQLSHLDRSLATIPSESCVESELARMYIVGQIHALKWAAKRWDAE